MSCPPIWRFNRSQLAALGHDGSPGRTRRKEAPADGATDGADDVQAGPRKDVRAAIPARINRLLLFIKSVDNIRPVLGVRSRIPAWLMDCGSLVSRSLRIPLEPLEPDQLVSKTRIRGVQATWIRKHEDPGITDPLRLRSGARAHARPEERAVDGDADEGDDLRLHARDEPRELRAPGLELVSGELGGRAGRSRDDVGQGETA